MLDHAVMKSVAEQLMSGSEVLAEGRKFRVTRTGSRRFRTVRFVAGGEEYQAIEQNAEKPSRWGQLARQGHRVGQVRALQRQKDGAAAGEGEVHAYGKK